MIPDGWQVSTISELAEVDPEALSSATDLSEEIDYISLEDVSRGRLLASTRLAFAEAPSRARRVIREGDVLFGTVRPNLQSHLYFEGGFRRPVASTGFAVVRATRENDPRFIYFSLMSDRTQTQVDRIIAGSNYPAVSSRDVRALSVLAPPPREQQAIAEALSDADALVESLDVLIAKKRDMKQAAMQQLLTGRTRIPGFTNEWQVRQVGDMCSPRSSRIDPRVSGGGDFCIELEHLESGTARLLGSGLTTATSSLKTKFVADDVLFGKLRSYLRKSWLANRSGVCSTEVWVLAAIPDVASPRFLAQVVQTEGFIDAASMSYGTHMPRSDWSIVAKYELEVPSLPEQEAVGTVLLDMDAEIDALVAQREKAELVKQGMMQELLSGRVRLV